MGKAVPHGRLLLIPTRREGQSDISTLDSFQNVPGPSPLPHSSVELSDLIQEQRNKRVHLPLLLTPIFIPTKD